MTKVIDKRGNGGKSKTEPVEKSTPSYVDAPTQALESLISKLYPWLIQQPEWPVLFLKSGKVGKAFRKRAANEIAKRLTTLPKLTDQETMKHFRKGE